MVLFYFKHISTKLSIILATLDKYMYIDMMFS